MLIDILDSWTGVIADSMSWIVGQQTLLIQYLWTTVSADGISSDRWKAVNADRQRSMLIDILE